MSVWIVAVLAGLLLTASNFLYQAMTGSMWRVAMERSYFQFVAVLIMAWFVRAWGAS